MLEATSDPRRLQDQLDFFQKLGFSAERVRSVQRRLGTDPDKVLGELVRTGAGRRAEPGPVTTVSVPVPRELPPPPAGPALRAVVIDGSDVAMSHGNKQLFSCLGIRLAVSFFLDRGHADVTVFVPSWRKEQPRPDVPITDQHILRELERKRILVFTPSRRVAGRRVVCNDDAFIVRHAFESDGVVVSNDVYRHLQGERPEWRRFIQERLLMYSFANNKFMPPDDPLGRHGPNLDDFLRKVPRSPKKQTCPYGRKCTYGTRCKFLHPERSKQSNRAGTDVPPGPDRCGAGSDPNPGQGLVEDLVRGLTLGHEATPLKKQAPPRGGSRSAHKAPPRKDKPGQHPGRGSLDQLDSGLGSIDSQQVESVWSLPDQNQGPAHGTDPAPFCSCCSCDPFQPSGTVHSAPYGAGPVPLRRTAFSQPLDLQNHQNLQPPAYRSDPHGARRCLREAAPGPGSGSGSAQRDAVRKKLLAIFSAPLVDAVMERFPQVLDPQVLVAEILVFQGQNRVLR